MSEENKAIVRRYVDEVQTQHKVEVLDQLFAPNIVNHGTPHDLPGVEGFKQSFTMLFTAFPDMTVTIQDQVAEGDKVVTRKTFRGTHKGEFLGIPPTGKRVEYNAIDMFRITGGKCTDVWGIMNRLGLMQQLGVIPPPGQG